MKNTFLPMLLILSWLMGPVQAAPPPPAGAGGNGPSVGGSGELAVEVRGLTVARDPAGRLWAVWEQDGGLDVELFFSRRTGTGWSPAQPVHVRPEAWDRFPSLAIGAGGTPWLAWVSSSRANPERRELFVSGWDGSRWTDPARVPMGRMARAGDPSLAAAPDGTLWVAWVGFDGTDDEILANHRTQDGWTAPWQVSANDRDASLYDHDPQLAVGPDGRPWLVWTGHQSGVDDEIYASRWTGTAWTQEQIVSHDDEALDGRPALALDAAGQPWVAWQGRVVEDPHSHRRILVSRWQDNTNAWTPEAVASSPAGLDVEEQAPVLGRDRSGRMHLAWLIWSGPRSAVAGAAQQGEGWGEPRVILPGGPTGGLALATDGESGPDVLWLDPDAGVPVPVGQATLSGEGQLLPEWLEQNETIQEVLADSIPNRYLAFGDSITWGAYGNPPFTPYPAILQNTLTSRVRPSEVINVGVPGETTAAGMNRIGSEVSTYRPRYVLIMEGTNDVTHARDPAEVAENLAIMIDIVKKYSGVKPISAMLATLIPRKDNLNDETRTLNQQAIIPTAGGKNVPLCDQWQAFQDYGDWRSIYWDDKHPNQTGLQLIADTFYRCILNSFDGVSEDTIPPVAVLNPLPPSIECGGSIPVSWSGTDNAGGSGVANFDVQVQIDGGVWTDWLLATPATSAAYPDATYGHSYSFRVRARDRLGNVSDYTAPGSTQVIDSVPPYGTQVLGLAAARKAPFPVSWRASDACSSIAAYNVQFKVGAGGTWQNWLAGTPATGDTFNPVSPQYGQAYYFQVSARDQAGNWSAWSPAGFTYLARYTVGGSARNVRDQPVARLTAALNPAALAVLPSGSGFLAYVATSGNYGVTAGRSGFGTLPAMQGVAVNGDVGGLWFILPPADDSVTDGGFEAGNLDAWQRGGTLLPSLAPGAGHTGAAAVQLGGTGGQSELSQTVPSIGTPWPTLSFLVRLAGAGPASTLQVVTDGASGDPVPHSLSIISDQWTHIFYDLSAAGGAPMTIRFTVADAPAVLLDEISIGSARDGGAWAYLPSVVKGP